MIVLLATLVQLSQTHTLRLFRITRDANNVPVIENVNGGEQTEVLLTDLNNGSSGSTVAELIAIPRALVEVDRPQTILINIAYPGGEEDLVLAETQIFRPLFSYRRQVAKRMRLQKVVDQK